MWLGAYKYAFEILRRSADGDMDPPEVILTVDSGVVWRFLVLQIVLGTLVLALILTKSKLLVFGGIALLVFLQPALTMTLAMTGSLSSALNPSTAFSIVGRVGWPYLAVVGLLFVIQVSAVTAGAWLGHLDAVVRGELAGDGPRFLGAVLRVPSDGIPDLPGARCTRLRARLAAGRCHAPDAVAGEAVIAQAEPLIREGRMAEAIALLRTECARVRCRPRCTSCIAACCRRPATCTRCRNTRASSCTS